MPVKAGASTEFQVVDGAFQGLVQSEDQLRHAESLPHTRLGW
jgi:hypothetical protein